MTDRDFRTLAYTKSPKLTRRTTFQDELEAAVSARASRKKTDDQYSYSDDFDEDDDEDDFLKELLKSRKKRIDAFKSGRSKATINNFDLSDGEGENDRPKRVSFMKTQRISSLLQDTVATDSHESEHPDLSSVSCCNDRRDSLTPQHNKSLSEERTESSASEKSGVHSQRPRSSRKLPTESLSHQTSEASQLDRLLPLPSDIGHLETPVPLFTESSEESKYAIHGEERKAATPQPAGTGLMHTDGVGERETPRPKPRQRTFGLSSQVLEERADDPGSTVSRPPTSVSIALTTDTASSTTMDTSSAQIPARSRSPHGPEGDQADSSSLRKSSSLGKSQQSHSLSKSTIDFGSRDGLISEDRKDHEEKYATSFEEFHEDSEDHPDPSVSRLSDVREKSSETRPSGSLTESSQRSRSVCSNKVESKYMGTLKILDRKVALEESQLEAADSLRAAIYQEWLKKKKEKLHESMRLKKQNNFKEEKKKEEEQVKREDAKASYEAWKQKKAGSLKAKAKEKQDMIRKEQRAIEEKEEKRESAKKMFEKWKQEHDQLLKEKYKKLRQAENKLKQNKQEMEEERQRNSNSAFSNWNGGKKNVLNEKVTKERTEIENKAEEERYMREERDKMALEMYEKWLTKKEREQRRQREERKIQAILQDDPPPPWSPPNKTVPFRK